MSAPFEKSRPKAVSRAFASRARELGPGRGGGSDPSALPGKTRLAQVQGTSDGVALLMSNGFVDLPVN
jgi:hypothetical protein